MIIRINNINERYFNVFGIFIIAFIFHLLFIFQGMDVTDTGYHLTNQVSAFSLPVEFDSFNSFMLLTDLVGGFWLSLIKGPSLLWARLGGVLIIALNAAIIFSILSEHFERKRAFFAVLLSTLILTMRIGTCVIDYFIFPALLTNIELWILNRVLMERGRNKFHNFLLGFMVVPIILSRVSLVLVLLIPAMIFIYSLIKRLNLRQYNLCAVTSSLGFCCAIIFFGFIYWSTGILFDYWGCIYSMIVASLSGNADHIDKTHTMPFLIGSYLGGYINAALGTIALCTILYTLSLIKNKWGTIYAWTVTICLTFGVILFMMIRTSYVNSLAHALLIVANGAIILVSSIYFIEENNNNNNNNNKKSDILKFLLFSGIVVMIINPMGSNNGILKSFYGMWMTLPLAMLCCYQLESSAKSKAIRSIFSLTSCVVLSLLIMALIFHSTNVYRDDMNRFDLNTEFFSPGLRGIYSTSDRVDAIDELIIRIKESSNKGDELLMFNSIPLLHYLTETRPALGNPWPDSLPLSTIKSRMENLKKERRYPKLFIYAKVNTRNRDWPNSNAPIAEENAEKFIYIKNELINISNYSLLWEDDAFAIYQRPDSLLPVADSGQRAISPLP